MMGRFDRNERLFGAAGQARLRETTVAVVGVGGLGTHVVQQLALLGVGRLALIDGEEIEVTNRNRYVGVRHDDPIPGTPKVVVGERIVRDIDPSIVVSKVQKTVVSAEGFEAVKASTHVMACLDSDGIRLIVNELCAAYAIPLLDLASDVPVQASNEPLRYGGRVVFAAGQGCSVCRGQLDVAEAQLELGGARARAERDRLYGVPRADLDEAGPSVVSLNGVIASLAVTEFMVEVTGLRPANGLLTYRGPLGGVTVGKDAPAPGCYYCTHLHGRGVAIDVDRYLR
jgi:molybdopterin-synthase adenylyltransferase